MSLDPQELGSGVAGSEVQGVRVYGLGPEPCQKYKYPTYSQTFTCTCIWGFPKIGSTLLGVPIRRSIVFVVYIGVPLFWETTIYIYIY